MLVIVCYDVNTETREGRRRLRRVAKLCEAAGQRVQKSVFECQINLPQMEELERKLRAEINEQQDCLRIYRLPETRAPRCANTASSRPWTLRVRWCCEAGAGRLREPQVRAGDAERSRGQIALLAHGLARESSIQTPHPAERSGGFAQHGIISLRFSAVTSEGAPPAFTGGRGLKRA